MSDHDSQNLVRTVRPHSVGDNRTVPRARIDDGDHRYDSEQDEESALQTGTSEGKNHRQRDHEKDQQKLSVSQRPVCPQNMGLARRVAAAYEHGTVAAVISALLASGVAGLAAWPSPLEPTAEILMQWTPLPIAEYVLAHFGGIARPAALLGALAIFMLCGGIAGALAGSTAISKLGIVLGSLASVGFLMYVLLVLMRPSTIFPEVCLIGAFFCALAIVQMRSSRVSNRRQFLERTAVIVGGAALLVSLFSVEPVLQAIATKRLFPFRRPRGMQLDGISDLITPRAQFYTMDKVLQYPQLGPPDWQLTIDGAVDRAATLDYGALLGFPSESRYLTMECVDNPVGGSLIGTALWSGVPVKVLLDHAGARGNTVVFHGMDTYPESTPTHELVERNALIAYGMNGETLPRAHGYPARLILPGIYGFKSVKWLTRLEIVNGATSGAWQSHGWTETAVVHATSRIDVARRSDQVVTLAGIAFAGNRGVRVVEVRANGGPWHRATLGPTLSRETWRQWAIRLTGSGPARFEVRVIDGQGRPQSSVRHGAYPNGSSGWATITV
jgi:DMSO/TMAO reductase YedYZ molybdopterin-dependent catalytic subunit